MDFWRSKQPFIKLECFAIFISMMSMIRCGWLAPISSEAISTSLISSAVSTKTQAFGMTSQLPQTEFAFLEKEKSRKRVVHVPISRDSIFVSQWIEKYPFLKPVFVEAAVVVFFQAIGIPMISRTAALARRIKLSSIFSRMTLILRNRLGIVTKGSRWILRIVPKSTKLFLANNVWRPLRRVRKSVWTLYKNRSRYSKASDFLNYIGDVEDDEVGTTVTN